MSLNLRTTASPQLDQGHGVANPPDNGRTYIDDSGTSMAAPHVGNGRAERGMAQSGSASALGARKSLQFPREILDKNK